MARYNALPGRFRRPRRRGEPLIIFLTLMMIWMGGRSLAWRDLSMTVRPNGLLAKMPPGRPIALRQWQQARRASPILAQQSRFPDPVAAALMGGPSDALAPALPPHGSSMQPSLRIDPPLDIHPHNPAVLPQVDPMIGVAETVKVRSAVAQQMLYLAAMANLPLPAMMQTRTRQKRAGRIGARKVSDADTVRDDGGERELVVARPKIETLGARGGFSSRWSGDGWLLMRQGGNSHALAGGGAPYGPTYGANQVGAVLRYRLMPGDAHKLTAYTRGYGALNGTGEREVAAGLSLRPLAQVPVIALAEIRASQFQTGQIHARPAVSLVTELPPVRLGGRVEAETYIQAGYVGGAAGTPFIDGQIRVEHVVDRGGRLEWRAGVGAWGGAQYGANRLDVGPTLRVGLTRGGVGARLAIDYRLRVKGNAKPTSGPAITLSAGF